MRRMRLFGKSTSDPVAAIEAEITGIETTKATLEQRIPALEAAKAEALTRRRESLIGGAGQASEADAHHAAREAESNLEAVADALTEVERRLADANERLAATRDQVVRDAVAEELERDIEAVDAAARKAREALAAFVKAKDALTATITPLVAGQADMGWRAPPDRIATVLVGNLLAADLPAFKLSTQSDLIEGHWYYGKEIEPNTENAADPIGAVLTDRLRALASDIRAGKASADLSRWNEPEPMFAASLGTKEVYVIKPFTYLDGKDRPEIFVGIVHRELPTPLADFAIKAGVATKEKPFNWTEISKGPDKGSLVTVYEHSAVRLGFDLSEHKAADVERQRAAWLAERDRHAA